MAKAKFTGVVSWSGTVAGMVYAKQPDGSVTVRRLPEIKAPRKPGQLKQQDKMSQAAAYWRSVKANPDKLAVYLALPRVPGLGPAHFAKRDFFHGPVIEDIDVSGYSGGSGQPIRVQAKDDTAVAGVSLQIVDMNETVLEEGSATQEETGGAWVYQSSKPLSAGQTVSVKVTAKDHPGNCATKSCLAYAR